VIIMARLVDKYDRRIDYLRISITDRCNLRCYYCMPPEGVELIESSEILSCEEIVKLVRIAVELGISKFRITGGEPLVRKGVITLIKGLKALAGVKDLALTTNGTLLSQFGEKLTTAGLDRLNISLDTLQPKKFNEITRFNQLQQVLVGIKEAVELGLDPVKINAVIMKGINDDEVFDFIELTREYPLHVRFIEFMPSGSKEAEQRRFYLGTDKLRELIQTKEQLVPVAEVQGNGPASYYRVNGALGTIGFISPISNHFCHHCNRLRLTATGGLRPCLSSDQEVNLKKILRAEGSEAELKQAFSLAVSKKPNRHNLGQGHFNRTMSQIGG